MKDWIRNGKEEICERKRGETVVLQYRALNALPGVRHCFSTRQGGVSTGYLSTMNFSFDRGDDPEHVRENYRRIAGTIGVSPESFVVAHQTHTTNILPVGEKDRGTGVLFPRPYNDVDGLMTADPGVTLVTYHADCIPVYLVDPAGKAIALLHAGWKGTVDGIVPKAVRMMRELYGTRAENLVAAAGPGICRSCYEIGEDVAERFREVFSEKELPEILSDFHEKEDGAHWQLDLQAANRVLLRRSGVKEENIHTSDVCTRCNSERLFSHRAHGVRRGLNAAFLELSPDGSDVRG